MHASIQPSTHPFILPPTHPTTQAKQSIHLSSIHPFIPPYIYALMALRSSSVFCKRLQTFPNANGDIFIMEEDLVLSTE